MKIETFKKAVSLLDQMETMVIFYIATNPGGEHSPDMIREREFIIKLNDSDTKALTEHIEKWLKKRKAELQKEFDNLK